MRESTGLYPRVRTDAAGSAVVSYAGAVLLVNTVRAAGLDRALSAALEPWRKPTAVQTTSNQMGGTPKTASDSYSSY